MRRILAAAVLLAFMPTANAQDTAKSDFSPNAEFRVRDTFQQNQTGKKDGKPGHDNTIAQRFKLGLGFKANENMSFRATLLQNSNWGQGNAAATRGLTADSTEDYLNVNEAYASWTLSDDMSAKFGRMNFSFGNGSVMGVNDYEATPFSFEGLVLSHEIEAGKFQFFAFKYHEFTEAGVGSVSSDPEHNAYGLIFDVKTMPEWMKSGNVFVIQDVADGNYASRDSQNHLRYGLGVGFEFAMVDAHADYVGVTGKDTVVASGVKTDLNQQMMQLEVGYNMPEVMGARFFVGYHQDSGTKASSTKNETYDSYFAEKHSNAGLMDIVAWGNLTDMTVGATLTPMDNTNVGLAYHMFSKTQKDSSATAGSNGGTLLTTTADKAKLGDEIDLWAKHTYGNGLIMTARLGQFMPGDALKDAAVDRKETVTQVSVEAKMTF